MLRPNTTYWIVVADPNGFVNWNQTQSDNEDDGASLGWNIADGHSVRFVSEPNPTWSNRDNAVFMFSIQGEVAPPPPTRTETGETMTVVSNMTASADGETGFGGPLGHNYGVGFRTGDE